MVDTCCENYDNCTLSYHDKDAEIKRLNEKIEFLARTNMLYSDWEHRDTQVTSELIRKGIEEHKINAELRAEIERLKQRTWVGLTDQDIQKLAAEHHDWESLYLAVQAKLKEKNT
jgi:cupin superfamily acireductone dioxygenase involved in methionine salvage